MNQSNDKVPNFENDTSDAQKSGVKVEQIKEQVTSDSSFTVSVLNDVLILMKGMIQERGDD
jgi:hypothetical protein